jgi:general stress protein 26
MPKRPVPEPVDPASVAELALAVLQADRFPRLATMDGDQPRLRPVSPVRTDGFTVYVANLRSYHKTGEIAANPRVELAYLSAEHDQLRISGRAEVVTEAALLGEIWEANPLLRHYLGSPDNPELIVYRIVPERVRFMREWSLEYHELPPEARAAAQPPAERAGGAHDRGRPGKGRRRSGAGSRPQSPGSHRR